MSVTRQSAVINEAIIMGVTFQYDRSQNLFDPSAISKVEIYDSDGTTLLESITSITKNATGDYQVITSATWNTSARTVYDRWYYTVDGVDYETEKSTTISVASASSSTNLPTAQEVRDYLEGYDITSAIISDSWIESQRDNEVVPYVQNQIGMKLESSEQITEYYSGNGESSLILNRRNITSLDSIELVSAGDILGSISLSSIDLIADEGILKSRILLSDFQSLTVFPKGTKNIKIVYTVGNSLDDELKRAVLLLMVHEVLTNISNRTGGGALTVQNFSRQYGNEGKYTNLMRRVHKKAQAILRRYSTSVVGA